MLTAKEAKSLVDSSEANLTHIMNQLETAIRIEANLGKRVLYPYLYSGINSTVFEIENIPYRSAELTRLQQQIADKLQEYGYRVSICTYTVMSRGGLGSIDGELPEPETAYRIAITW